MSLSTVPTSLAGFRLGGRYLRKEIHDQFKGQRQYGISTPAGLPVVFIFTDTETEAYGYSDRFLNNGVFIYSGEGQEGDMEMERGNERIKNHAANDDALLVFEKVGEQNGADIFSYDGDYEYVDHFWEQAPDATGTMRQAVRFKLAPRGGIEAAVTDEEINSLSDAELFEKASESATSGGPTSGSSGERYTRSDVVRAFAQRVADGVCHGCGTDAPFMDSDDEPFLEVHHLHRRSDGGVDAPENVIAICPNCHREVHYGKHGERLNARLIKKATERNQRFTESDAS
ncbi:5-methylcytosine-specific restriction enzyme A [Halogranum amylolyticum]|uniref:5-methylcytosine-specific restriction enzyme A n=1 Tax=Halogranum amylolyticum TaxID=660520 RepID=A0A1H8VVG6_9EURY|nr:HNH endonuclease signature motif containing protein [Halogranum amylolyticum]SEP19355.1 5-methylcytosine-specific restriction enzyme A [Halogranum amylolyticum]